MWHMAEHNAFPSLFFMGLFPIQGKNPDSILSESQLWVAYRNNFLGCHKRIFLGERDIADGDGRDESLMLRTCPLSAVDESCLPSAASTDATLENFCSSAATYSCGLHTKSCTVSLAIVLGAEIHIGSRLKKWALKLVCSQQDFLENNSIKTQLQVQTWKAEPAEDLRPRPRRRTGSCLHGQKLHVY